jgi:hypothetical protein
MYSLNFTGYWYIPYIHGKDVDVNLTSKLAHAFFISVDLISAVSLFGALPWKRFYNLI